MQKFLVLLGFILLSQLAGALGSLFTFPAIDSWYALLNKPSFSPPNWVFGPVWTLLYTLMGIAAFLVYEKRAKFPKKAVHKQNQIKEAMVVFGIQLILNSLWSIIFFGFRSPGWALFEIFILWIAIAVTIHRFARIKLTSAVLMLPYLLWVTFALMLNLAIVILN